jgi:hypothetical protein
VNVDKVDDVTAAETHRGAVEEERQWRRNRSGGGGGYEHKPEHIILSRACI